jgi:bifunctional DNA-binding transcriptional regulator/antitoxin component of YhaV-PrlF toxin-antitoxin module
MSKVTSKLQVTLPKALANQYGIRPGDEIEWKPAGNGIRVEVGRRERVPLTKAQKLALFDDSWKRQMKRQAGLKPVARPVARGWTREELYTRGRPR